MIFRIASYGVALAAQSIGAASAWSHPGHVVEIVDGHGHGLELVAIGLVAAISIGLIWRVVRGSAR